MAIQIKLKNSVVQDSTPSTSDLPEVGELALNANINSIGGFMRASDNSIVKIFGPGSVTTPTATTTVSGIAELATSSETTTGTATNRVVTPAGLNAVTVAERTTSNTNYVAKAGSTMTGVLQLTAGSASAPAIHFGDSDSGIYAASGGNNVRIAVGGSDAISASTAGGINFSLAARALTSLTLGSQSATDKPLFFADANSVESSSLLLDNSSNEFRVRNNRFSGKIVFAPSSNVERARIDNGGKLLVGTSTARTNFFNAASTHTPRLQVESTSNDNGRAALGLIYGIANASGPYIVMAKHRSNTVGDNTVVVSGDETGIIAFQGADGSQFVDAARIQGFVDGTPGADDMPGRLEFSTTADGAASPTTRLTIDSAGLSTFTGSINTTGNLNIGSNSNTNPFTKLTFGASQFGAAEIRPTNEANHKVGLSFYTDGTNDSLNPVERLRIDSSGRVHIGTATNRLGETLHVLGQGIITSSAEDTNMMLFGTFGSSTALIGAFNNIPVVFRQNNTERMRVHTSGNVGIATSSPAQRLHVYGNSGFTAIAVGDNSTAEPYVLLEADETNNLCSLHSRTNNSLTFKVNNSERMRIDTSGRLLIGTTTTLPAFGSSSALQVAGTGFADGSISIRRDSNNAFSGALVFGKSRGSAGGNTIVQDDDQIGSIIWTAADGTDLTTDLAQIKAKIDGTPGSNDMPGRIEFHTTADGASGVSERMRIDSSGRVLIGSTTADDAAQMLKVARTSGTARLAIQAANDGSSQLDFADVADADVGRIQYDHNSNYMALFTQNSEHMRIDSSGNVGIGTTSTGSYPVGVTNRKVQMEIKGPINVGAATHQGQLALNCTNNQSALHLVRSDNTQTSGIGIGSIMFSYSDGTDVHAAASILAIKGATGGDNDTPGTLTFSTTADGANSVTEHMRITSGGNVAIGNTSPQQLLHVWPDAANTTSSFVRITAGDRGSGTGLDLGHDDSGNAHVNAISNADLIFSTNNTERMRIKNTGYVGIGTSSPDAPLVVRDSTAAHTVFKVNSQSESTKFTVQTVQDSDIRVGTQSNHPLAVYVNQLERVRIDTSGKIGINETSPLARLHIKNGESNAAGYAHDTVVVEDSDHAFLTFLTLTDGSSGINFGDAGSPQRGVIQYTHNGDHMRFITASGERMRIDSSGNIGLGVTSISDARFRIKGVNNSTSSYNDGLMVTSNNETVYKKYSWAGIEAEGGMKFAERVNSSTLLTTMEISTAGNVTITGSLSKGSGSFKIDHPLPEKTDTHNLVHSFVEGPQADNIYRGKVDLVSGTATVNIDKVSGMSEGTFVLLNRDIQCFTSNETGWTAVKGSVSENILTITVEDNTCTDTISWLVIGERQDSHMKESNLTDDNGKIIVEPLKEA